METNYAFQTRASLLHNVTPTDMESIGQHTRSYKQAQDQDDAVLLLDLNRARCASSSPTNHHLQLPPYNDVGHSVTKYAKV